MYEISLESCPGQVEADTICGCSQAASITCQAKGIKKKFFCTKFAAHTLIKFLY